MAAQGTRYASVGNVCVLMSARGAAARLDRSDLTVDIAETTETLADAADLDGRLQAAMALCMHAATTGAVSQGGEPRRGVAFG